MSRLLYLLIAVLLLLALACGDDDDESPSSTPTPGDSTAVEQSVSGDLTVFAAASLTNAFTEIGETFEDQNPDATVTFNFAGSQDLRTQLEQGAPADVFASADNKQMTMAVEGGVIAGDPAEFAMNRLVVILPENNAAGIETLQDLAIPGLRIVIANPDVPVGNYTRQFLEKASADASFGADYGEQVLANVVSEEDNVRQVAAKVQLDEADAGVVYSSDVTTELAPDVLVLEIPDAFNTIAHYPIATTAGGDVDLGDAFIAFVLGGEAQAVLEKHGFIPVAP